MPKIIYQYAMVANIKYAQLCVFSKKSAAQRSTVNLILVNLCRACQGWAWPYSEQLFVFIPRTPNPGRNPNHEPRVPAECSARNPNNLPQGRSMLRLRRDSGTKKRPRPEDPDPESPMCCYLLVFADDLFPDNVGVHIDNLLWVSQICGHFSEVVFLVLLNGADDVKGF